MIGLLGRYKLGALERVGWAQCWPSSAFLRVAGGGWGGVAKEDLGIIFSQGPLSIFMYLWWQTSV